MTILHGKQGLLCHKKLYEKCGSVIGQDTSEPQPSTGETKERHNNVSSRQSP